jgi:hypothetical protein
MNTASYALEIEKSGQVFSQMFRLRFVADSNQRAVVTSYQP